MQWDTSVLPDIKIELYHAYRIAFESSEKIISMMSVLNSIAYCVATKYGILKKCINGGRTLVVEKIPQLLRDMAEGNVTVSIPVTHWQDYIKRFWNDACSSQPFLRKLRAKFAEMGLFNFVRQKAGSTRKPPELQCVDVVKVLALYELLEDELKQRDYELQDIGVYVDAEGNTRSHKGAIMRVLYEAILNVAYRRKEPLEPLVKVVEAVPNEVWLKMEEEQRKWEIEQLMLMLGDLEPPY